MATACSPVAPFSAGREADGGTGHCVIIVNFDRVLCGRPCADAALWRLAAATPPGGYGGSKNGCHQHISCGCRGILFFIGRMSEERVRAFKSLSSCRIRFLSRLL